MHLNMEIRKEHSRECEPDFCSQQCFVLGALQYGSEARKSLSSDNTLPLQSDAIVSPMKLLSNSSSLHYFYQKTQLRFFSATPTRTRLAKTKSASDSLCSRIFPLGDPNLSVVPALDQWIGEGKHTFRWELQKVIHWLMVHRRFKHALEVSLWMTNNRGHPIGPFDIAVRLKLIYKMFGLEQVEDHFNKIPQNMKTFHVYLALLNCYTMAKSVDKAESVMQKARDLGYVSKAIWYNLVMNLHYHLGNSEKLSQMLTQMDNDGIAPDPFTLFICLNTCAMSSDAAGMDRIVKIVESDPTLGDWKTYATAAEGYLKMGLVDKALTILNKLENNKTTPDKKDILFIFLLKLYAEAGKKGAVYRIWNRCKNRGKVSNKVYISMMRALTKFGDIEGMEKIIKEWDLSGLSHDFRVPNLLIDAYCTGGFLEKAEDVIAREVSRGCYPQAMTWCHLVGGYLGEKRVGEAVEALKKAISLCPAKIRVRDSLTSCLEYLEKGEGTEKAEELIKLVRARGVWMRVGDASDVGTWNVIKDAGFESGGANRDLEGVFGSEDEIVDEKGNMELGM
ncbi:pentatricopeptide repeat-containing protein at2g20710 mitochondrial [Phtheirospermum japonicum]|uniref:Pentatricopeptide repeat-containing protein at2g20710 mitochondrial n=1 Tax=Phtheirospermum japonicum TaxID=374723 RepID=A0A830CGC3_9LAMI|nr:pentatricopeptide repeat-containing protein at2g20710 mitochondrial [Phtheirospermum japonicum]